MTLRWLLTVLLTSPALAQPGQPTVDPHSPVDLITQVNTLTRACNGACTIRIPAGSYTVASGTILIHQNGLSLAGDGRNNTIIHYAGTNFLDSRLDASTYGPSFTGSGRIGGFTVFCTNPNVRCITGGSVIGQRWEDLAVVGPGGITGSPPAGAAAEGFAFQNTYNWMERTIFRDIVIGGFNANFHFMAPRGGTDSFGYALFDGIYTNQSARSRGFVVDKGVALYNVLGFSMQYNSAGTTDADEVFSIAGAFTGVGFHLTGENSGAPITLAHIACEGIMNFEGDYNVFGGGIKTDCLQSKDSPHERFRIAPRAGLTGIAGSQAGTAPLKNWNNTSKTYTLWADPFNPSNPASAAYLGYIFDPQTSKSSPLTVYDWDLGYCMAARTIYSTPESAKPRLCVDGPGNVSAVGDVKAPAFVSTRGTPTSSYDACTPGESWDDDNFHYHCTRTGIKRLALTTF